jgi:alpha-amylase
MQKRVTFILGLHNHQPVGNFEHIFQEAYKKAYLPFLEVLGSFPDIPFVLHNSGVLWDWLEEKHPEYMELVASAVERKQAELMSGGYYEPILSVIPERDRQGQLAMMRQFLKERFGTVPRGCWLTERIWEPHLPRTLEGADLEYVVVDDAHFKATGFGSEEMRGFFLSEEDGRYIRIFPIDKSLRYLIPFKEPEESIEYLRKVAREPGSNGKIVVLADDGEKFGLWPGTHKRCYSEGWLERMCELLTKNSDWLELSTFSRVIDSHRPEGIVYLPTASYSEMMEWALPYRAGDRYRKAVEALSTSGRFDEPAEIVRGGFWRNFLVKYEEANWMHKRMVAVSEAVETLVPGGEQAVEASRHLFKAQCNCAYWHGLFGGLYLPHLRSAIFRHLIEAENIVDSIGNKGSNSVRHELRDLDGDGRDELMVSTASLRAYFRCRGGSLRELDVKSPPFNLTDSLTRRREIYHRQLASTGEAANDGGSISIHERSTAKEKGLERLLRYDRRNRESLVDHFIGMDVTPDDFASCAYDELGDFLDGDCSIDISDMKGGKIFTFVRKGLVRFRKGPIDVGLTKKIRMFDADPVIEVEYEIEAEQTGLECRFAVESALSLLAGDAPDRYFVFPGRKVADVRLASSGSERDVERFGLVDEWMGLEICFELDPPAAVWRAPIETVSNSEAGFERVYQGSAVSVLWPLELVAGKKSELRIRMSIGKPSGAGGCAKR